MKRFYELQKRLLKEINQYERMIPNRDIDADWERLHISSCAKLGYLLAEERDIDPDLAACACAVHDYGRILTGKHKGHAEAGYEPSREFLAATGLFSMVEVDQISICVKNHSNKGEVGNPLEELVKDADILDYYQYGNEKMREDQINRLNALLKAKNR